MTSTTDIDVDLVRKLAGLLDETQLTEIEYAWGEFRVRVARQPAPVQAYGVRRPLPPPPRRRWRPPPHRAAPRPTRRER